MKCILHIGSDKTGSTSIQYFMSQHRQTLIEQGFCYPTVGAFYGNKNNHGHGTRHIGFHCSMNKTLPSAKLLTSNQLSTEISATKFASDFIEDFDNEIRNANCHTVVMSDEDFFRASNPLTLSAVHQFLTERFDDITIFLYCRPLSSYLNSAYNQYIKMGGANHFDQYCNEQLQEQSVITKIGRWVNQFGIDNIMIKPFPSLEHTNIINDFLASIGIKDASLTADSNKTLMNQSISKSGIIMLRRINSFYKSKNQRTPEIFRKITYKLFSGNGHDFVRQHKALANKIALEQKHLDDYLSASIAKN